MLFDLPDLCPPDVADSLVEIGLPKECVQATWVEYRASVARLWHEAQREQAVVSKQNFTAAHRPINGIGQAAFRISAKMQQVVSLLSAMDAHKDKHFQQRLIADNPQFCFVPTVEKKPIIVKPAHFGTPSTAP